MMYRLNPPKAPSSNIAGLFIGPGSRKSIPQATKQINPTTFDQWDKARKFTWLFYELYEDRFLLDLKNPLNALFINVDKDNDQTLITGIIIT